jgi:integrase
MERAREHANEVADQVIIDQVTLFELATRDPGRLRSGELTPLPSPADNADDFTHYDRLVAEGDLEAVIAFLQRFRLRKRINDLARMRVTGNLAEFIPLASTLYPQLASGPRIVFARLLLAEELRILQAAEEDIAFHEFPRLAVEHAGAGRSTNEPHLFGQSGVLAPQISLDELFQRWEQEADPSASTLSTWRGVVKNLKAHLGRKAADIRSIDSDDIVAWKDKLVKSGKSAKTIGNGYLACARVLFRFAVANKLAENDPAEGVKVARKAKAGKKMLGYDNAEVARILELASAATEPWKRWLPWLAVSTGSRIGEVAQLHGSHVLELEGIYVVKIAPAIDGGSIKNVESERYVPIHSKLIADGFLDFVKSRGETRESNMRRPAQINARVTARVAIIELRSLLVADAPISRRRREDLIDKATRLARSSKTQAWAAKRLCALIEQRFARNPDTFQTSKETHAALQILSMLQEGKL